jgi:hypothetical protein
LSSLTKIFIVLQLICSLIAAVVLVVAVKSQTPYKALADADHMALIGAQASLAQKTNVVNALNSQITQLNLDVKNAAGEAGRLINQLKQDKALAESARDAAEAKIAQGGNQVTAMTNANEALAKQVEVLHQEIARMGPENNKLITQNAELSRANNEAVTQLRFAESTIRKLQEELAAQATTAPKGGAAVSSESGAVASLSIQAPAQINGKVSDARNGLVELPLGARDGVRVGTRFTAQRGTNFIADVVIDKVTPDASVGHAENVKKGEAVRKGDLVTSGAAQ